MQSDSLRGCRELIITHAIINFLNIHLGLNEDVEIVLFQRMARHNRLCGLVVSAPDC
jgi:hypothetical protein